MKHNISSTDYEKALYEKLLYEFPPPAFRVMWDDRTVLGRHSKVIRQIDVAVYRGNADHPFLVAEAKRRSRKMTVDLVDCFIGKLDDIGPATTIGLLVCPSGCSKGGRCRAEASGARVFAVSVDEALEMMWRPIAREIHAWDWAFHPQLAAGLYHLRRNEIAQVVESIEMVPFDEWMRFVEYGLANSPSEAAEFLRYVSLYHPDDGWRFNAIQESIVAGLLSQAWADRIVAQEKDPEIKRLLEDYDFI